jgi:hypothetical protein
LYISECIRSCQIVVVVVVVVIIIIIIIIIIVVVVLLLLMRNIEGETRMDRRNYIFKGETGIPKCLIEFEGKLMQRFGHVKLVEQGCGEGH